MKNVNMNNIGTPAKKYLVPFIFYTIFEPSEHLTCLMFSPNDRKHMCGYNMNFQCNSFFGSSVGFSLCLHCA